MGSAWIMVSFVVVIVVVRAFVPVSFSFLVGGNDSGNGGSHCLMISFARNTGLADSGTAVSVLIVVEEASADNDDTATDRDDDPPFVSELPVILAAAVLVLLIAFTTFDRGIWRGTRPGWIAIRGKGFGAVVVDVDVDNAVMVVVEFTSFFDLFAVLSADVPLIGPDTTGGSVVDVEDDEGVPRFDLGCSGSCELTFVDADSCRVRFLMGVEGSTKSLLDVCLRFPMSSLLSVKSDSRLRWAGGGRREEIGRAHV